jgi:hypothetical protein
MTEQSKLGRWMFRASVSLSLAVLTGCAAPNLRNVVYENIGPSARLLSPYGNIRLASNNFRYVPGAVVALQRSAPADHFTRSAALLDGDEAACYHKLFTIGKLKPTKPEHDTIVASYDFKFLLQSPFTRQAAIDAFLQQTDLEKIPDGVFAYIRQVDFRITNIRIYEASPQQLSAAFLSISSDAYCARKVLANSSVTVRRIYVGDVDTYIRWDKGYSANLWVAMSTVQKSLRYSVLGRRVVFAVETD